MGVQVRLVVYAPNEDTAVSACRAAYARVAQLDGIMSDYRHDSELMRLCAQAPTSDVGVRVSDDLFRVLQRAQEVAKKSDGAFDVTTGPLVKLWREARKTKQLSSPEAIASARERVGWKKMRLNSQRKTVHLLVRGMQLDMGGIGKGYAGDCALKVLRQHGIIRALFEAGGDIVLGDPPPRERGWQITLFDTKETLALANCAVSTSADTEQFVEIGGVRYSHIVDPYTGLGLTNRIAVTVIAPDGLTSDPLTKVVSVMGEEKGRDIVNSYRGTTASIRNLRKR